MRHILCIILFVMAVPMAVLAQKDLNAGRLLDGHLRKHPTVSEIEIKGARLSEFSLSYYHSLTVQDDASLMDEVTTAFVADEAAAVDKELTNIGGHLYTGIYRMTFDGDVNRFLFYKDMRLSPDARRNAVIIIYMEGNASLKTLQRKFKK